MAEYKTQLQDGMGNVHFPQTRADCVLADGEKTVSAVLNELSGRANPNLLINGGFTLWQRGDVFQAASGVYTADRWYAVCQSPSASGAQIAKDEGGLRVEGARHTLSYFFETAEKQALHGMTLTLSWKMDGEIRSVSFTFDKEKALHVALDSGETRAVSGQTKLALELDAPVGTLRYVKLEVGENATPWVPVGYYEEYAKSRWYYQKLIRGRLRPLAYNVTTNQIAASILFPEMRTVPSVPSTISAEVTPCLGSTSIGTKSFTVNGVSKNGLICYTAYASSTAKQYYLYLSQDLALDAEIYPE